MVTVDNRLRSVFWAAVLIAGAAWAAYSNTFDAPFVLDDGSALKDNASIKHLARLGEVLRPPATSTTSGRPVLNLSFALNFACGGLRLRDYHATNLVLHICAGLTLFGIARRSIARAFRSAGGFVLSGEEARERRERDACSLALLVALVWVLHPLQTNAVTYISQRAESLMGWFYLLTLYGFIRYADDSARSVTARAVWGTVSVACCFLGMATKEVMVTAPVTVLLYDRAFLSDSFRQALTRRRGYYLALASSWLGLAWLMMGARLFAQPNIGFHEDVNVLTYALTEAKVVATYAKLAAWPHPLVFDYGLEIFQARVGPALPYVLPVIAALAVSLLAWRWSRPAGFLATTFFVLLAPTSSVVPVVYQPMAESRMYLPLAALVALAALGGYAWLGRRVVGPATIVVLLLGVLTWHRNADYRTALGLWADTVAKQPGSSRAHYSLGHELSRDPQRAADAIREFEAAIRLRPINADAHGSLADLLARIPGRHAEAIGHYEEALRLKPLYVVAHNNLANELAAMPGRQPDAVAHYEAALRIQPDYVKAHYNLANVLAKLPGHLPEAIRHYERATQLEPDYLLAHNNLAIAYSMAGRLDDAIRHAEITLRLDPAYAPARKNLELFRASRR